MKWILIATPPILVVVYISIPILNSFRPWNVAQAELERYGSGGMALCVGMHAYRIHTSDEAISELQRSNLLPTKKEFVAIIEVQRAGQSELRLETSSLGFWFMPALFLVLMGLSVRLSIPMITAKIQQSRTS